VATPPPPTIYDRQPEQVPHDLAGVLFEAGTVGGLRDAEPLERFVAGVDTKAEPAFAVLMERPGSLVQHVCRSVPRDEHAAEDALTSASPPKNSPWRTKD